jgi:hypothetical protein
VPFAQIQHGSSFVCFWSFLLGSFSSAIVQSQEYVEPLPSELPVPELPAVPEVPPARPSSFYAAPAPAVTSAFVHDQEAAFWSAQGPEQLLADPLQWGPVQARPFATYRFTYGDGISAQPGKQETTALHQISPGLVLNSKYLTLTYTPTLSYYSSDAFDDTLDHAASLSFHGGYGDWTFGLGYSFSKTSQPLIETGAQTPQENHSTALSAQYRAAERISFDLSLSQNIQKTEALNSSRTWSSMNWLNYHVSEKTLIGAGVGGGYVDQDLGGSVGGIAIDQGANSTFEQIQGRVDWNPSQKLNCNFNGGIEIRQFLRTSLEEIYPVMGASVSYTPWEQTTFSILANRAVGASLTQAQPTENTTFSAGLRQRLLGKLNLNLFGSFGGIDYQTVEGPLALQTGRNDETLSFSATLGARFLNRGDISIFYQHSENNSSSEDFSFTSDQYGFQIGYRF